MSLLMSRGAWADGVPRGMVAPLQLGVRVPLPRTEPAATAAAQLLDQVGAAAVTALRDQVLRQCEHWAAAVEQLADLEELAAPQAWAGLERYVGVAVRDMLSGAIARLRAQILAVRAELAAARTGPEVEAARQRLVAFRRRFLQAETMIVFYTHAIACRANPDVAALMRACDALAAATMRPALSALGRAVPPVLTFVDQGLGAAINRAGLRMHDGGTVSAVSTIKVVWRALSCPTSDAHEAAHQVAFTLGANEPLAAAFAAADPEVGPAWAGWASECLADAIALCAVGYGSVALLHDVVAGEDVQVYSALPGDPHPPAVLRVGLAVAGCRLLFGAGPWDDLELAWQVAHPLSRAPRDVRAQLERSWQLLPQLARIALTDRYAAYGGRSLVELYQPERLRPEELMRWARRAGPALWTSSAYLADPLRVLAYGSFRVATEPERVQPLLAQLRSWLLLLGRLSD